MKRIVMMIVMVLLLVGCNDVIEDEPSNESEPKQTLYQGLDERETYDEAVAYTNENVTYFREKSSSTWMEILTENKVTGEMEFLISDDKVYIISERNLLDGTVYSRYVKDDRYGYNLYTENERYSYREYEVEDQYLTPSPIADNIFENPAKVLLESNRKEKGDEIHLTFRFDKEDGLEEEYKFVIDSTGYIVKTTYTVYMTTYGESVLLKNVNQMKDINKHKSLDIKVAIEEIQLLSKELVR